MSTDTAPKSSSRKRANDPQADADTSPAGGDADQQAAGRKPDATVALANIRVSGWLSPDTGWSFVASRSYRDQAGETVYSQMTLFVRDLLPLATVLQAMAQELMTVRMDAHHDEAGDR